MNSDSTQATVIGEGLSELTNNDLTKERREDIATALGVPHSLLFSNAATFATARQDTANFMQQTIIPEAQSIQQVLNAQLFKPMGYTFEFRPEELQSFQEEEVQRAQAFAFYTQTMPPEIAGPILGIDLPSDMEWDQVAVASREWIAQKRSAQEKQPRMAGVEDTIDEPDMGDDLRLWARKATRRLKAGKSPAVEFVSESIPDSLSSAILGALEVVKAASGIKTVFDDAERWGVYP